jgi:hypothetical protein
MDEQNHPEALSELPLKSTLVEDRDILVSNRRVPSQAFC